MNHWHLLRKLLDRNVPKRFVRLLMAWLTTQAFTVRWGGVQTTSFKVTNGVRQGGILSPRLFAIYVDKLSEQLESSKVGCHINKQCMNHLFYADDAVLLAPTVDALQKLIDVCQEFARKGDMVYNFEKSECTAFIPNTLGHIHTPDATLPRQWSLITISQDNHSFHPMFPTDHCRLVSIFPRKVRWRSEHLYTRITDTCRLT